MRDNPRHPESLTAPDASELSERSDAAASLSRGDPRVAERTDTSWVAPDPPPIPDRIRKKVDPKLPSLPHLPAMPAVPIKVNHRWLKLGLMAGGAVVLGLVLALVFRASAFDASARAQWESLCNDYARWFAPLGKSLDYHDKEILRDVGLSFVVDTLADAQQYDPRVIADRPGSNLAAIGQRPPATARSPDAIRATRAAAAALRRVEVAFAKWPTAAALESHHVLLVDHGWGRVAELVENTLKQAPPYGRGPVGPTLVAMQRLEAQTAGIALAIERLELQLAFLEPFGDPVFDALARAVRDLDHQAPSATHPQLDGEDPYAAQLLGLAEALGPLEAFAQRFAATVQSDRWAAVDYDQFRATGRAYALLAGGETPSDKVFRTWLDEADGFRGVDDDWRPAWADAQRAALSPAVASLGTLLAADHLTAKPLGNRIDQLHARIGRVVNTPLSAGMANELDIQRNYIERDVRDLVASAQRLGQEVTVQQTAQALREAAPLTDDPALQSPAAETVWQAHRQQIADRLERDADLAAAARDLETTRQSLLALLGPHAPESLPAAIAIDHDAPQPTAKLLRLLHDRTADQRDTTLKLALHDGLPVDAGRWSKLRDRYVQQSSDARRLADLVERIDRAFAGAYPLEAPAVTTVEGGLAEEVAGWARSPLLSDPAVADAALPVFGQVYDLQQMRQTLGWLELSDTARHSPDPATAFAAWRQMGVAARPRSAESRDIEAQIQTRLEDLAKAIGQRNAARGAALHAELAAARTRGQLRR